MKLTPASRALATIRVDVASSAGPPNIMVPRKLGEIFRPLRPSERYCMGSILFARGNAEDSVSIRHCEERSDEAIQSFVAALDCFAPLAMTAERARIVVLQLPSFNILNTPLAVIRVRP